jgi:hypothetical protein
MNSIYIDVEITTMSHSFGMPYSIFDPSNPFIQRNTFQHLPYRHKFHNEAFNGREVYWVLEEEVSIIPPSLDLQKAFNCFNLVPSIGAKYSLKLCADVPNNDRPTQLPLQPDSETGHTFIVVTKSNGTANVVQVFGFYAQKHPGYIDPLRAMPSIIRNNRLREINASIEMSLTEAQFEHLRKKAFELAKQKYDVNDYNCTNYGLDLFNSVRTKPLTIDSYTIYLPPLGPASVHKFIIDKTPQMLFKKLQEMKNRNDSEASCIFIDQTDNSKAPLSHGECN